MADNPEITYPHIAKAHLEIAYDNGGINRGRSAEQATEELITFLEHAPFTEAELAQIDAWIGTLSDEDLNTACAGEESEILALLFNAPHRTDELLTSIFNEVC